MTGNRKGVRDPELRWQRVTRWGEPSDHRPDLGPCLIFTGADNGNGYGQFTYGGRRNGYAHRYAWERVHGPIADGLTVDHLCRVRRCVNVDHLELTDAVDNYLRGVASRNQCPNGHEYTAENLYSKPNRPGVRFCRKCKEAASRRGAERRTNAARGLPNRRIRYDQNLVRAVIADIRAARSTIAVGARQIGCNPGYLGRRVWAETKAAVKARDDQTCIICNRSHDVILDVHHRAARGMGGASNPRIAFGMANLITLCRGCHRDVELYRRRALESGWLVAQNCEPRMVSVLYRDGRWVLLDDNGTWKVAVE